MDQWAWLCRPWGQKPCRAFRRRGGIPYLIFRPFSRKPVAGVTAGLYAPRDTDVGIGQTVLPVGTFDERDAVAFRQRPDRAKTCGAERLLDLTGRNARRSNERGQPSPRRGLDGNATASRAQHATSLVDGREAAFIGHVCERVREHGDV